MTAYSFTDLRIKSMQIKGERPVIVILSGAGLSAEAAFPPTAMPTTTGIAPIAWTPST